MSATVAWGDESIRHKGLARPMYLICACIIDDVPAANQSMRTILPEHSKKLHWRDLTDRRKRQSIDFIQQIGPLSIVIAAEESSVHKDERARRKCLERLLPVLESYEVSTLVLESRTPPQDQRDLEHLAQMRTRHLVRTIRMDHIRGSAEPCLWIPDQVLGAYGDTKTGKLDFSEFLRENVLDEIIAC